MRVTTPIRDINVINDAILKIKKYPNCTSLRSVEPFSHPIEKVFTSSNHFIRITKALK